MPGAGDEPVHVEGEEHRLAAILVGDVADYTRLIAEDEEQPARGAQPRQDRARQ